MTLLCYSLTTNLILSAYFHFKLSPKRSRDKGCLTAGKKSFTMFCCRKLQRKRSKCEVFYLPGHWPAPFLSTVNDANQIIL